MTCYLIIKFPKNNTVVKTIIKAFIYKANKETKEIKIKLKIGFNVLERD